MVFTDEYCTILDTCVPCDATQTMKLCYLVASLREGSKRHMAIIGIHGLRESENTSKSHS
jgi:hypothetical protein